MVWNRKVQMMVCHGSSLKCTGEMPVIVSGRHQINTVNSELFSLRFLYSVAYRYCIVNVSFATCVKYVPMYYYLQTEWLTGHQWILLPISLIMKILVELKVVILFNGLDYHTLTHGPVSNEHFSKNNSVRCHLVTFGLWKYETLVL